jgi:hypothetical protein
MANQKWRLLLWSAALLVIAGAAGIVADAAVAGVGKASGLAGVIAGLCELAGLMLAVAGLAGRRRAALPGGDSRDGSPADPAAAGPSRGAGGETEGRPKYVVDARESSALQVGDGNLQHNDFRRADRSGAAGEH